MRLAVCRCFLGRLRSSSSIRSITPRYGSSLGRRGGDLRRYPGGAEYFSILLTVSRCSPNTRAASRVLIPSTMQARRTRAYISTLYILHTFHRVAHNSMEGGGRYGITAPHLYAITRLHGPLLLRRLQHWLHKQIDPQDSHSNWYRKWGKTKSVSAQLRVLRDYTERNGHLVSRETCTQTSTGNGARPLLTKLTSRMDQPSG